MTAWQSKSGVRAKPPISGAETVVTEDHSDWVQNQLSDPHYMLSCVRGISHQKRISLFFSHRVRMWNRTRNVTKPDPTRLRKTEKLWTSGYGDCKKTRSPNPRTGSMLTWYSRSKNKYRHPDWQLPSIGQRKFSSGCIAILITENVSSLTFAQQLYHSRAFSRRIHYYWGLKTTHITVKPGVCDIVPQCKNSARDTFAVFGWSNPVIW